MHESTLSPPYHNQARLARIALQEAIRQAQELLPPAVRQMRWMAAKHSPSPWRTVEGHAIGNPTTDPAILAIITDLALMSDALSGLTTVLTEPTTSGTLKLAKVRRVEI